MQLLYKVGLWAYNTAISLVSPFNEKAGLMKAGRRETWSKISAVDLNGCYWFHAPSLGEFEQGRPVIEAIKTQQPDAKILLTFFSPSGYEVRKNYALADVICYLPADSARNAKKFIQQVQPSQAIFIKYDIWYYFLKTLHQQNIPAYLISAIFRPDQVFFKPYGKWYKKALTFYRQIFVQQQASYDLLVQNGVKQVTVAGDTRFDRVYALLNQTKNLEELETFKGTGKVVVIGSSWPKDEDLWAKYIHQSPDDVKFIIAPHEIHASHIQAIESGLKVKTQKWSSLKKEQLKDCKVLIIDTIGLLSSLYKYGEVAYIGGGFGVGIHNTLEAATYGMPVLFGPNYQKFQEAKDLISIQAAHSISTYEELKQKANLWLTNSEERGKSGNAAAQYVKEGKGATEKILNTLLKA